MKNNINQKFWFTLTKRKGTEEVIEDKIKKTFVWLFFAFNFYFLILTKNVVIIDFRDIERETDRERNNSVREKHE